MNLFELLNRGAAHAPKRPKFTAAQVRDFEAARRQWMNALLVEQTRAWMSIGEKDREVVVGLTLVLTIAGFISVYDSRDTDRPDLRIIRGAVSTAEQCMKSGYVITADHARAFSSAAARARELVENASYEAIIHASNSARNLTGLQNA